MKRLFIIFALLFTAPAVAQDMPAEKLTDKLAPIAPYIGTWSASLGDGVTDVSKWEWIMGGKAVQITHSINDGAYGGRSIVHWNGERESIAYRYVTTARFFTEGNIHVKDDGSLEVEEIVWGNMDGASETRSGYSIKDGKMHTWSQLKYGIKWGDVSNAVYSRTPDAKVIFK